MLSLLSQPDSWIALATLSLLEVVLGPLWVWLALREQPGTATLVGGAIVIGAVIVQATARRVRVEPA